MSRLLQPKIDDSIWDSTKPATPNVVCEQVTLNKVRFWLKMLSIQRDGKVRSTHVIHQFYRHRDGVITFRELF